jgi:hypothetical protein
LVTVPWRTAGSSTSTVSTQTFVLFLGWVRQSPRIYDEHWWLMSSWLITVLTSEYRGRILKWYATPHQPSRISLRNDTFTSFYATRHRIHVGILSTVWGIFDAQYVSGVGPPPVFALLSLISKIKSKSNMLV